MKARSTKTAFTLTLLLTIAVAQASAAPAKKSTPKKLPKLTPQQTAIYVSDMHCKTCAKKISRKLYSLKGVVRVGTNVKENLAIVTVQKNARVKPETYWKTVQAAKFEPVKLIGPDGVFVPNKKTKQPQKIAESPNRKRR